MNLSFGEVFFWSIFMLLCAMGWGFYIKSYQSYLRIERGLADNSIQNYTFDVERLSSFLESHAITVSPVDIGESVLQDFIYQVAKEVNARSQARIISGLKSFFSYLIFEGYRSDNPLELIETPRIGRKLPDTLSVAEVDKLIASIDLSTPEGERNKVILETLYGCGLRVSELTVLKISDLYFDEGFVRVTGKGNKQRFVPLSKYNQKLIEQYKVLVRSYLDIQKGHEDTLFLNRRGAQLTRAMIFTIIRRLADKIGLQKKVSPHTFRHSYATHLLENGADLRSIQLLLGHESITTTEVYVHLDRKHLKQIMHKYHPRR